MNWYKIATTLIRWWRKLIGWPGMRFVLLAVFVASELMADPITVTTDGPATVTVTPGEATVSVAPTQVSVAPIAPNHSRPLPVLGCWNTGENQQSDGQDVGYTPDFQLQQLLDGVPWSIAFEWYDDFNPNVRQKRLAYFEPAWSHVRNNRLPVVFVGRNFIDIFRLDDQWGSATPPADHPFLVTSSGIVKKASPWSPHIHQWYSLGKKVGTYLAVEFAADYPEPPQVLLFDNNEAGLATIAEAMTDVRYVAGQSYERAVQYRYAEFRRGLKDALPNGWKKIQVVGYGQFGNEFGINENTSDPMRYFTPWYNGSTANRHDGCTCNVGYLHNWGTAMPGIVRSPQMEAGNVRWALAMQREVGNREFLLETNYWNGKNVSRDVWLGVVRCVLWQMQTENNRLFLGASQTRSATYDRDMQPLEIACREVHDNPTLQRFWKYGTLLHNRRNGHPYQWMMAPEFKDLTLRNHIQHVESNRRYRPWNEFPLEPGPDSRIVDTWTINREMTTPIDVFAICHQLGDEYLVYAHAPNGARGFVEIDVYATTARTFRIVVDVPVEGAFWLRKADGQTERVS